MIKMILLKCRIKLIVSQGGLDIKYSWYNVTTYNSSNCSDRIRQRNIAIILLLTYRQMMIDYQTFSSLTVSKLISGSEYFPAELTETKYFIGKQL